MPEQKTYYEILGVPRDVDTPSLKKRFRELVRQYHPDVRQDKAAAEKVFVQITEAYKTLIDPVKRAAYDGTLVEITRRVQSEPRPPYEPTVRSYAGRQPVSPKAARVVKEAELAFIRRRLVQAENLCIQAIAIDQSCARAHAILGDIHRARRKYQHAINEYTYAIQFDPADTLSREKMERLIDKTAPIRFSWESPDGRIPPGVVALYVMGWGFFVSLLFLVYLYPGKPIPMLAQMHIPFVRSWSWNLIGVLFGDGVLGGFLLGSSGFISHPDEELVFEASSKGRAILPTGFLLLVFGPFFFLGVAIIYILFAFIQDALSRSIVAVIALVMAMVLFASLLYTADSMSVIVIGGNVAYLGVLAGWYLGARVGRGE